MMRTTWRSVILAIAASLLLAVILLFVIFRVLLPYQEQEERRYEPLFVIASWEGQVAVFEGSDSYPMQVFDVDVRSLPPEEQEKIQAGIPVEDADQLSLLLEDYTS